MNTNRWIILGAILIVVLVIVLKSCHSTEPVVKTVDNDAGLRDSMAIAMTKHYSDSLAIDSLKKANAFLGEKLSASQSVLKSPVVKVKKTQKKIRSQQSSVSMPAVTNRIIVPQPVAEAAVAPKVAAVSAPSPAPSVSTTFSVPKFQGNCGVWVGNSDVTYWFKKTGLETETPQLNEQGSNRFFTLVGDSVYIYTDQSIKVTPGMVIRYAIFIGIINGYPAYYPHEWLKPFIRQVKGTEAGYISRQDLLEIGKLVPDVASGKIRPHRVIDGQQPSDSSRHWEGWEFAQ